MKFNVVITYEPGINNSDWVFSQLNSCIGTSYVVAKVRSSIILLNVQDPYTFWYNLRVCIDGKETPIHRIIPVDEVVDPIVDKVAAIAREYALKRIPIDATFRITLHGHLYTVDERGRLVKMHSIDAIRIIAQDIDRKVDLKNPQWVIYIRSISIRRWQKVAILSVARSCVFKNIRVAEIQNPI
ncbi:MAG: hypothetical protein QXG46_05250 [Ignisphaera sp.]